MSKKDYTMRVDIRDNKFFTGIRVEFKYRKENETFPFLLGFAQGVFMRVSANHAFHIRTDHRKKTVTLSGIVDNGLIATGLVCVIRDELSVL